MQFEYRSILSTLLSIYGSYCLCGLFFIVTTFVTHRNFRPLLHLACSAMVLFTPYWTFTALDHITEAFDKTSPQWRVWRSIHVSFLSSLAGLVIGFFGFVPTKGRDWAMRYWPYPSLACIPLCAVVGFFAMLAIVEGYGWEEFYYIKELPSLTVRAMKFCARKAPRAIYRYWQLTEPVEGSLLTWWANDRLEQIMRLYEPQQFM